MTPFQYVEGVNKYGHDAAASTTENTIWSIAGSVVWGSTTQTLTVSSSSALDTSTGSGARSIRMWGLGTSGGMVVEDKDLSGQTGVATTNAFSKPPYRMKVISGGTDYTDGSKNQGIIYAGFGTVTSGVPDTVLMGIAAGDGQTQAAVYTVPDNRTGDIETVRIGTSATNRVVTVTMHVRDPGEVFVVKRTFNLAGGISQLDYNPPFKLKAGSDVEWRAQTSAGTEDVTAEFDVKLYEVT